MLNNTFPLLLYGAGGGLQIGIDFVRRQGMHPSAVIDADIIKQGRCFLGLNCISLSRAIEEYGQAFYVYITPYLMYAKTEIYENLIRNNIPKEQIVNTHFEEIRYGCSSLESTLIVSERIRFCCMTKDYPDYAVDANWRSYEEYYHTYLATRVAAVTMLNDASSQKNHHCFSCPYCVSGYWQKRSEKPLISMISWGYDAQPCNCRCSYCDFSRKKSITIVNS